MFAEDHPRRSSVPPNSTPPSCARPARANAPRTDHPRGAQTLRLCLLLLWAASLWSSAAACSLPVFRYALDRWPADTFRLHVAGTDAADPAVAKFLRNYGANSGLNLEIARSTEPASKLMRPENTQASDVPVWSGKVTQPLLESLGDTKTAQEIVRRLLGGESAVWILVESGDPKADDQTAALVEKRLRYLQQIINIPPVDPNDLSSKPGPGPEVAVQFSLLRLPFPSVGQAPENPASELEAERLFLSALAGPNTEIPGSKKAWLAAVFGRGRVIGAWPAEGFGDEQIEEICLFLAGACSCQVKRQNPGWDLLLKVDWDEKLHAIGFPPEKAAPPNAPASTSSASPAATPSSSAPAPTQVPATPPAPETVRIEPKQSPATPPASSFSPKEGALKTAALALFCLVAFALLRKSSQK